MLLHARHVLVCLGAAAAIALTGCSGTEVGPSVEVGDPITSAPEVGNSTDQSQETGEAATSTADDSERTVSAAADGTILTTGDQASFVMPSGNIQCVMRPGSAICQIASKQFDPAKGDMDPNALGGCTPESADAVTVIDDEAATWGCTSETIRGQAALELGGWWAADDIGDTENVDGTDLAVLSYGQSLQLGQMLCVSESTGISCRDLNSSAGFTLAREDYSAS